MIVHFGIDERKSTPDKLCPNWGNGVVKYPSFTTYPSLKSY
jgi:hypothetical protein